MMSVSSSSEDVHDDTLLDKEALLPRNEEPVSWKASILFAVFGLGSWVAVNAVFAEMPIFIQTLPEGRDLPALLSVALQLSNAVLLVYVALSLWAQSWLVHCMAERVMVVALLALGCVGLILLAFLWDVTSSGGRSVALLSLTAVAGVADSMSSVVFLPILSHYARAYASPFAVGEACTSLLATLLAIVQDPAGANRFSVTVYFLLIAGVTVCSGVAYFVLAKSRWRNAAPLTHRKESRFVFMPRAIVAELGLTVLLNFCENGVMVSLLTFCIHPYGDAFYKAALWGGMSAAPLGSITTLWFAWGNPLAWSLLWVPLSALVVVNASVRPVIALGSLAYPIFLAGAIVGARFFIGFTKSLIYLRVLDRVPQTAKEGSMLLIGLAQQLGASLGSLLFFLLIFFGFIQ